MLLNLKPRSGIVSVILFMLLCEISFSQTPSTVRFIPGKTPAGFESEINNFLRQDSISFPPAGAVLFTGSSTIRKWDSLATDFKEITLIQRGFGGSTMNGLNYYTRYIVLPYKPDTIVVYEGDNDLLKGTNPVEIVAQCDTFIQTVHNQLPGTMIWFMAVKPSFARLKYLPEQNEINRRLKKLTRKRSNTGFIDIRKVMFDREGNLRKDYFEADSLHVNHACYKAWAAYMKTRMRIKK